MNRAALILALAGLLAGCSGARAAGRSAGGAGMATIVPETQINRVRAAGPFTPVCATGQVRLRIRGQCAGGRGRFHVPPGPQALQVAYTDDETPMDDEEDMIVLVRAVPMTFLAEAGHTYAVRGRTEWTGHRAAVTLWIVDGADGRTITSLVVPPENVSVEVYVPGFLR